MAVVFFYFSGIDLCFVSSLTFERFRFVKGSQNLSFFISGRVDRVALDVLEPTFSEHRCGFWGRSPFGTLLMPLATIWPLRARFGYPFGSMLVHVGPLKPTLRPTTPKKVISYSFVHILLDFGLFWNGFQQSCVSIWPHIPPGLPLKTGSDDPRASN